jgi:Polyketide cyclase / dehydrase and lipid transport
MFETVGVMRRLACAAATTAFAALGYRLVASGDLTLDTGIGRRLRPLGPLSVIIDAPRDTVFDVISAPYLDRTPRALAAELEVLERGGDMVIAAHRTPVGWGMVTTTVESVRFDRPATVSFRLLRGPVPHVVEEFALTEESGRTRVHYTGELGTDFGSPGARWGEVVARRWVTTVTASLERVRIEAERRAAIGRRH